MTTLKLLFDEDIDHRILRGLRRAHPEIDIRSVMEVGLAGKPDREILAWAATEGRLLVTKDVHTMTAEHSEFVQTGRASAGVVFIPRDVHIGRAISDLALICGASTAEDWKHGKLDLPTSRVPTDTLQDGQADVSISSRETGSPEGEKAARQ